MAKRLYINKEDLNDTLTAITAAQVKANTFLNVAVKEYHGKKYDPQNTLVIVIG